MANTLFLRLDAPLQSWGEDSQWSERRTAPEPTKSGVVGMLACAMGWDDDERIRNLSHRICIGVRCDIPGTPAPLRDYHTVGGGYGDDNPQLLTADGSPKKSNGKAHTEQTWRYYLCDASFLVAIQSKDEALISDLAEKIQCPHWPIFLGRKSCVPSLPPYDGTGEHKTLNEALEKHPARFLYNPILGKRAVKHPRIVLECKSGEGIRHRDQFKSRKYWLFSPRYSKEELLKSELQLEYLDKEAA
jgi:CRISPR system Cascade subunit CasD